MIITVLSLSGPPYKSQNAKRGWFVLVFDVIMLQAYCALGHKR